MSLISKEYLNSVESLRKNKGQWQALNSEGNCVILAGPGSGKTKTLVTKVAKLLIEEVNFPRKVACITFNNECVREIEKRLFKLGINKKDNIFVGTVHSFFLMNIVEPYAKLANCNVPDEIRIISPSERKKLLRNFYCEYFRVYNPSEYEINSWDLDIGVYRRKYTNRTESSWLCDEEKAEFIIKFEERLRSMGMIDFDDIIVLGANIVRNNCWVCKLLKAKFPVIIIDEYQDLGEALHDVVVELCINNGIRLIAVGDPDQSIYGFNGSNPNLLMKLTQYEKMEVINLKINYRCCRQIVNTSQTLIGRENAYVASDDTEEGLINVEYREDGLQDQIKYTLVEYIPTIKTKYGISNGDIAILYVNKNHGDIVADQANKNGYEFVRIDNNAPYQKTRITRWLEDCARWCTTDLSANDIKLSDLVDEWNILNRKKNEKDKNNFQNALVGFLFNNRNPEQNLFSWLSLFKMEIIDDFITSEENNLPDEIESFEKLYEASRVGKALGKFSLAAFAGQGNSPECLNLITLHSAKGREFEVVIIPGLDEGYIPRYRATSEEIAEGRRLFYVGLTRAKKEALLLCSGFYENSRGKFHNGASRYLIELYKILEAYDEASPTLSDD